jgi:peptidoglycan hydrolase-like protein with peptidoglycan-binding domain
MLSFRFLVVLWACLVSVHAQAQGNLLPENIMAIQESLIWTGDYDGPVDGSLGSETREGLAAFQSREGQPATGRVNTAALKKLAEVSAAAKRDAGWRLAIDGKSAIVLWIPGALLPKDEAGADGRTFSSEDGDTRLALFSVKTSLAELRKAARAVSGRRIDDDKSDKTSFTVAGEDNGRGFVEFATGGKTAKGFRLSFPLPDADRMRRIGAAMAEAFVANPGEALPKKTARSLPSFLGAYRLDEPQRPYPYGVVDVENREVTIAGGDITARLSAAEPPQNLKPGQRKKRLPADAPFIPKLNVFVKGEPSLVIADPDSQTHFAEVRVVELDPSNRQPEVVLTWFTGGAKCCTKLSVFSLKDDGSWTQIAGGEFESAPDFPQDVDGDGRFELVNADNAFLDAFGCKDCPYAPSEIRQVNNGTLEDVSADPRFREHHRKRLGELWAWGWQSGQIHTEAFLAGFVAAARRAGDAEDGWALMQKLTPKAKGKAEPFPARLQKFLESEGY